MASNIPTLEQIQALKEDTTPAGREKFFRAAMAYIDNADKFANEKMAELKGEGATFPAESLALQCLKALEEDKTPAGREKFLKVASAFTENAKKFANEKMAELKGDPVVAAATTVQRSSAQLDNIEANLEATLRHVRSANAALRSSGRRPWWMRFLCC